MSRLGIRRRLLLLVLAAVAAGLAAMLAGFNLLLNHNLARNADDVLRARAAAELGLVRIHEAKISVAEAPDDASLQTNVWVFSGGRTLESPRAGEAVNAAATRLAAGPSRFAEPASSDTRLYSVPIVENGRRLGTVVAGVSLAPYEETRRTASS